ncbi:MAG: hypothetical protein HFE76_14130 [Firmicutes bacterium]|nr:hypothetical protein [Bacillota bacterium]
MYRLTAIQGGAKETANYKATWAEYNDALLRLWERVLIQFGETVSMAGLSVHPDLLKKMTYLYVKYIGTVKDKELDLYGKEMTERLFESIELTMRMIGHMTPRQIMQMFPVSKTYNGERWQCKDYYSTMKEVEQVGLNTVIGKDKASEFLMEYENQDIREFMITFMLVVSRMRVLQGGRDILEEFMEEQGVPSYSYYQDEGIMINRQTGGAIKVEKPKTRVPKYMKVIEGGLN